jgi:hypothetical protein
VPKLLPILPKKPAVYRKIPEIRQRIGAARPAILEGKRVLV